MKASELIRLRSEGKYITQCGVQKTEYMSNDRGTVPTLYGIGHTMRIAESLAIVMEARRIAHIACPHGYRRNKSVWQVAGRLGQDVNYLRVSWLIDPVINPNVVQPSIRPLR